MSRSLMSRTTTGCLGAVLLASTGLVLGLPSPAQGLPAPEVTTPEIRVPLPAALRFPMPRPVWL